MNKIVICNTHYQIIVAMQLKFTKFKNDDVGIIITDHSEKAKEIANRLRKQDIFKWVFFLETRRLDYGKANAKNLYLSMIPAIFGIKKKTSFLPEGIDEVIYYNLSFLTLHIFATLNKSSTNIKYSRMEEGILSYNMVLHDGYIRTEKRLRVVTKLRKAFLKKNVFDFVSTFYCFQPEFYKGNLKPVKIEPISLEGEMKTLLVKIFSVRLTENSYKEKYIFFTSVYDFEGGEPIGEYELVCKIADLVGKENLLIKTHPRDTRTIYEDNGFTVDKNSDIPWEAIQLSRDFSDKVFLTATSGSVLAGSFMSENPPKTFFMYKCCNNLDNKPAQKSVETIEALLNDGTLKETLKTVAIANDVKDILI